MKRRACKGPPAPCPSMNATVSFGGWIPDGIDRFPQPTPLEIEGQNRLSPREVTIRAGGAVNFILGQAHVIAIYASGTRPQDIDVENLIPAQCPPLSLLGPVVIDDANGRIYRGLDPSCLAETITDRVEVVAFDTPGRYLVICAVAAHFIEDGMYGYVNVV